jgi:predicted RNA-binding Zn-ribbon protein involved in translation (DUF1610 family)
MVFGEKSEKPMADMTFRTIEPRILYFGTPVAWINSLNEDLTTNLAPMSSFLALGWTLMLGLLYETKTAENLTRTPECLVNRWESVHVCPGCGHVLKLNDIDLKAATTGLVFCPNCEWSGPIEIQIIELSN